MAGTSGAVGVSSGTTVVVSGGVSDEKAPKGRFSTFASVRNGDSSGACGFVNGVRDLINIFVFVDYGL
jgi:uridine phosphorylase